MLPKTKSIISGIFLEKKEDYYYFILPNIYHSSGSLHTFNILSKFDKKITTLFDEKISDIPIGIEKISYCTPLYHEKFKCKIADLTIDKLRTGLEYQMSVNLYGWSFIDETTLINGWSIKPKTIKEVTLL